MTKASQPAASKTPLLLSKDSAGEVQSHVPGPLGGFCRLSATWKLLCTHPACHESTTSIHQLHCTFLTSLLPLTLRICIHPPIPTHIFASNPGQPISPVSLFLSHSRPAAASGRLHHFHFLPSEPVPIRASARHTNPPPRIHLTAIHNTLRQLACSLYVTA